MPNGVLLGRNQTLKGAIQKQIIDFNGEPQEKTVVPSVEAVVVEPDKSKRLTKVTVLGVTSAIDENISPMNIRRGKTILGVEGNLEPDKPDQSKVVRPSVEEQVVRADTGYELASVTVEGVTSDIDENIQADNIRYGVEILGVVGSMEQREDLDAELNEQEEELSVLKGEVEDLPILEFIGDDLTAQEALISDIQTQLDNIPEVEQIPVEEATATESDVVSGKTFFSGNTEIKTGTLEVPDLSATTATTADVLQGKKFYNAQGELVEGGYKDMLQRKVDSTKNCQQLFSGIKDEDMSWVKNIDTTGVTNMSSMFYNCDKAKIIDVGDFDTSAVTTMYCMFQNCSAVEELDLRKFNASKVTNIQQMFDNCKSIINLDFSNMGLHNFKTLYSTFNYCSELKTINLTNVDTSEVTSVQQLFNDCSKLETVLGELNLIKVTNTTNMLNYCKSIKNITLKNIKTSLAIGSGDGQKSWDYGYLLANESLINTIQQLWDNTDNALGGSRTLTLSTTSKNNIANIYVKLIDVTDEMRTQDPYIDNKKPCVVCESTDEGAMTLTEYAISKGWAIA